MFCIRMFTDVIKIFCFFLFQAQMSPGEVMLWLLEEYPISRPFAWALL